MSLAGHPTVVALRERGEARAAPERLEGSWLRQLCLECGADDAGFVELGRPELAEQRADLLAALPGAQAAISLVVRMNREPIRSPARSVANLEFHHANDQTDTVAHELVRRLEALGVRALNPSVGFPMEVERERFWVISHKPIAVAAGLGRMGIHRNVIHPRFGNFILLATVLVDRPVTGCGAPLDYNPCLDCKLCVAACPVGAVQADGRFDFTACQNHNYREFLGGFSDWVGQVADSRSKADYQARVTEPETLSMWQSLSYGANYKAAYCMAVCPAGEDVIGPFLADRKGFLDAVVRPLQQKAEPVYVARNSDAERHVRKRFPHKQVRLVSSAARARSIRGFLFALPHVFQREAAGDLAASFHLTFTGAEEREVTVEIRGGVLTVREGRVGQPDLSIRADSQSWLAFLAGKAGLLRLVLTRKVRLSGKPQLLRAFGRCFPG